MDIHTKYPSNDADVFCQPAEAVNTKSWLQGFQEVDKRRIALEKVDEYIEISRKPRNLRVIRDARIRLAALTALSNLSESLQIQDDSIYSPQIEKAIESSEFILKLEENWDEEGSPRYSEETWHRATQFVRKTALLYKKEIGVWIDPPKITPGPDGSIDVRWKSSKRSILINFPANSNTPADFYGSDKQTDVIKGTLNLSSQNHWILQWLNR
jgi:hypothetical protein